MTVKLDFESRTRVMIGMLDEAIQRQAPKRNLKRLARKLATKLQNHPDLRVELEEVLTRYVRVERRLLGDPLRGLPGQMALPKRRPRIPCLDLTDDELQLLETTGINYLADQWDFPLNRSLAPPLWGW